MLALLLASALTWGPGLAQAEEHAAMEARGIGTVGSETLITGLQRLLPQLVAQVAAGDVQGARARALQQALAAAEVPGLAAAYGNVASPLFLAGHGLTPLGRVTWEWLQRGLDHGVDGVDLDGIAAQLAGLGATRTQIAAPSVADDVLLAAWQETGGGGQRLSAMASVLGAREEGVRDAAAFHVSTLGDGLKREALLEVSLAAGLVELAASLPARPMADPVLLDDKGRSASPDVLWRGTAAPTEGVAAPVIRAAREGRLHDWLHARTPTHPQYRALVAAATRYAAVCDAGGWEELALPWGSRGRRWKDEVRIGALQTRLGLEGFWEGAPTGVYDDATYAAVKAYQTAHHLRARGTFNRATAVQLNVACAHRLEVIRLNARRWRHSALRGDTHVHVNIPAMEIQYTGAGELRAVHRAVVGSGRWFWDPKDKVRVYPRATPVMQDTFASVVVNPTWTAPSEIVNKELRPKAERDPEYLEKGGWVIKQGASGKEVWVQQPGPRNALGEVKLVFPNTEAIFLHDTNQRGLFREKIRDFSHGCVRVDKALDLATVMLQDDMALKGQRLSRKRLHTLATKDRTFWFGFEANVGVFLEYYTASVGDDGLVRFHPDVYDYDRNTLDGPITRRTKFDPRWQKRAKPGKKKKRR